MAIICAQSCSPVIPSALPTQLCKPILRNIAPKRLVMMACDADTSALLTGTGADKFTALAALWNGGVNPQAFVTQIGQFGGYDEDDPTEVKLGECGYMTYVAGKMTLNMAFRYGWDITPAAVSPAVDEYAEETFWNGIKNQPTSWNYGFVNCNKEVGFFLTPDGSDFANGSISVKWMTEEINDCTKLAVATVKVTFSCGALAKRMLTLTDENYDDLISWI